MKYRALGGTGASVSVIGLGTHQFTGEWSASFTQDEVRTLLERASDLGINFLDTAECYGDHAVEELIGNAIAGKRERWIVATKFGHSFSSPAIKEDAWSPAQVKKQLEDSLRALRTDYIDLYQFHSGGNADFQNQELWSMLHSEVEAGRIRYLGISLAAGLLHKGDLLQVRQALSVRAEAVQVVYNRLNREAETEILPFCRAHSIGVLARVPLAKGFLAGMYQPGTKFAATDTRASFGAEFNDAQLALAARIKEAEVPEGQNMAQWALGWCLKQPAVSAVIVGCKSVKQLETNAAASDLAETFDFPSAAS